MPESELRVPTTWSVLAWAATRGDEEAALTLAREVLEATGSNSQRSLKETSGDSRVAKNRKRWPLDLDTRDPEQVASFTLSLGYEPELVVNTLVRRCNLDLFTAKSIVQDVLKALPQEVNE